MPHQPSPRSLRPFAFALTLASGAAVPSPAVPQQDTAAHQETVPQQDTAAHQGVWLEFAWPVGLSADVETARRIVRRGGGEDSDVTVASRYRMTVRDHPRGLAIDHTRGEVTSIEAEPELPADHPLRALHAGLAGVDATYIVSSDGMLLAVEGVERGADALDPDPASAAGDSVAAAPPRALASSQVSDGLLESIAGEQWGAMIWFWAWEEFHTDSVYSFHAERPSPTAPGADASFEYRVGFLRHVPCRAGDPPASCVRLEARARPTADALQQMAEGWALAIADGEGIGSAEATSFDQESTFSVVLEPSTMVPHEFRMRSSITAATTVDGTPTLDERVDETVMTFRYPGPSAVPDGEAETAQR